MTALRLLRLLALLAIGFSSASAVEHYAPSDTFCGGGGGCDAVAASAIGQLLGPWLPILGLSAYTLVLTASLFAETRKPALWLAVAGGLGGLVLLAIQALAIGQFCQLCLGADLAGVAVGALAVQCLRRPPQPAQDWPATAWAALLVLAVGIPPAYAASRPEPVPEAVRALWQPGKINVVEFSDFECPYCRQMHPVLTRTLLPYGERVNLVRRSYPLASHAHAAGAAAAYVCARVQGKGEPMAHELFSRDDLSGPAREVIARDIGLDVDAYLECVQDEKTKRQVEDERELVSAAGMRGLPTVWIGETVVLGFRKDAGGAPYEAALKLAAEGRPPEHRSAPWLWVGGTALALAAVGLRRKKAD